MNLTYEVDGEDFSSAGEASSQVKKVLKKLGVPAEIIKKVSIAMYEAEINMVIHANGGVIDVEADDDKIYIRLVDQGPGIPDIDAAMKEGFSTASNNARELGFGAGMGLPNIKKNTDFMNITTELGVGTTVEFTVNLA